MFENLIHAALHKVAETALEAIGETKVGKKVGDSLDNMLNNSVEAARTVAKQTGKIAKKGIHATTVGVNAAVQSFKNQKS